MKQNNKILVCFALAVVFCLQGFSAVLKVPQQFTSIYKALLKAQPGDTIAVSKGVYYENIALVDEVVIQGEDKKNTIIN